MKISEIRAVTVDLAPNFTTKPRVERQDTDGFISPMRRYPEFRRADWSNSGGAPFASLPQKTAPGVWA